MSVRLSNANDLQDLYQRRSKNLSRLCVPCVGQRRSSIKATHKSEHGDHKVCQDRLRKWASRPMIRNMRITFSIYNDTRVFVLLLCLLSVFVANLSAQDFKTVHDGVEYAQVVHKIGSDPVKINLLRLDLKKVRLDVHHALDKAIGTEKTSSIATRHGAVAAINAGFFRLDRSEFAGDAAGTLMIDHRLLSESEKGRIAIFIRNTPAESFVSFAHININDRLEVKKREVPVSGINRQRKDGELVIFTPQFGASTLTDNSGVEFIVRRGRVSEMIDRTGNAQIPSDGFVISVQNKAKGDLFTRIKVGTKVTWQTSVTHNAGPQGFPIDSEVRRTESAFSGAEDITNGVSQLIRDGKIDITWEQEKASRAFAETRHPRTAVAKLKGGKFLMVTVDGRQPGVSVGMILRELAEYLLSLGAVDAMNLDGGGSTTMFLDGKVVNTPSDKEGERKIGDAILVTLRNPGKRH